jgi:hypothetical protein
MKLERRAPGPAYANLQVARQTLWGFGGLECEYNFCDIARTLRMGENAFRSSYSFKELRVVKGPILQLLRYVPDGSLRTASAEQIFPRDCVQQNVSGVFGHLPDDVLICESAVWF